MTISCVMYEQSFNFCSFVPNVSFIIHRFYLQTLNKFSYNLFNEQTVISFFFTVSGIFTSLCFIPYIRESKKNVLQKFWSILSYQLSSIYMLIAASIFLYSSLFSKINDSPFWNLSTSYEMQNCKKTWMNNFMLVQNYINNDSMCNEPTWIFAAEFQLIIFAFILLSTVESFQKYSKKLFGISLIASFLIVASSIYFNGLHPFVNITPE